MQLDIPWTLKNKRPMSGALFNTTQWDVVDETGAVRGTLVRSTLTYSSPFWTAYDKHDRQVSRSVCTRRIDAVAELYLRTK